MELNIGMSTDEEDESSVVDDNPLLSRIYEVISHDTRREIIKLIGQADKIAFKEIVEYLHIRPGTFYFHLKKMPEFITQLDDKRYCLTPAGNQALKVILNVPEHIATLDSQISEPINTPALVIPSYEDSNSNKKDNIGNIIFNLLKTVYEALVFSPRTIIEAFSLIVLEILFLNFSKVGIFSLYLDGKLYSNLFGIIALYLLSYGLLIIEIIGILTLIKGKTGKVIDKTIILRISVSTPLATLPLYLFPAILIILDSINLELFLDPVFSGVFIVVLQIITAINLYIAINTITEISKEKSFITVLILLYISVVIGIFLQQIL